MRNEAKHTTLSGVVCVQVTVPVSPQLSQRGPGAVASGPRRQPEAWAPPRPRGSPLWGHLRSRASSPGPGDSAGVSRPLTAALTTVPHLPPTWAAPSEAVPASSPGPCRGLRASASLTAVSRPAGPWCSCPTELASTAAATTSWRRCWWGWACWSSPTTMVSTGPLRAPHPPHPTLLPPWARCFETGEGLSPRAVSK